MKFVLEPVNTKTINLLDFDRKGLTAFFVGLGEKPLLIADRSCEGALDVAEQLTFH